VHVDVTGDSGSGGATDVHADVHAVGRVNLAQHAFHLLAEGHHFISCSGGQLLQFIEMSEWHHHHMAGGVGKAVQDDVAVLSPMDDLGLGVGKFGELAEDTAIGGNFALSRVRNVGVAPGSPEIIHRVIG